jgi:hypothetical protein
MFFWSGRQKVNYQHAVKALMFMEDAAKLATE